MLRSSASSRRVVGIAVALSVGTGIGLGAYSLGSTFGTDAPRYTGTGSTATTSAPLGVGDPPATTSAPSSASATGHLTLDEATAIAVQAAPGRVVEWDEDHEPTGLRYDVTLLHDDGSTTDVEVDTVTGQVVSIDHDTDGD